MKPGTTSVTFYYPLTAPSGLPPTGLTYTNLDLRYTRTETPRVATASTNLTVAGSTTAVWVASTVIEMDADTGLHRFDVPDAALEAGASRVVFSVCDPVAQSIIPISWTVALEETADEIAAIDVDSTDTPITLAKAIEIAAAYAMGNAEYGDSSTEWTVFGRDGVTPIATITEDGGGNRSGSSIP